LKRRTPRLREKVGGLFIEGRGEEFEAALLAAFEQFAVRLQRQLEALQHVELALLRAARALLVRGLARVAADQARGAEGLKLHRIRARRRRPHRRAGARDPGRRCGFTPGFGNDVAARAFIGFRRS